MTVKEYTEELCRLDIRSRHVDDDVDKIARYIDDDVFLIWKVWKKYINMP